MADFSAQEIVTSQASTSGTSADVSSDTRPTTREAGFANEVPAIEPEGFGTSGGNVLRFKMRALASPGPGFVVWVVTGTPDFAGGQAPAAIQAGTAVVADHWTA